ncbi:hypothetical protein K488DRAFT_70102 [Vararia minispora EC-137]|uniref:Uncharacterized protein n=1 Tax=Vararia minispora EC-137 TaxID=1314806 RepID=A0ACB8QML8_9AGAM|nr:hypothetical protein K488DRAFT_70102 [Vararia minispora EC-137]
MYPGPSPPTPTLYPSSPYIAPSTPLIPPAQGPFYPPPAAYPDPTNPFGISYAALPSYLSDAPTPTPVDLDSEPSEPMEPREPDLVILCHAKTMVYAPGSLIRTYDDTIAYIKETFPSLADTPDDTLQLYVMSANELIRVPRPAWPAVFPTLGQQPYSSNQELVFVEVDGAPSGLPAWPFHRSIQQWFAPTPPPPPPQFFIHPPVMPLLPSAPTQVPADTGSSSVSTESLTVRPARQEPAYAPERAPEFEPERDMPPPPFSSIDRGAAPRRKRSFWGMLRALFGGGKRAGAAGAEKGAIEQLSTGRAMRGSLLFGASWREGRKYDITIMHTCATFCPDPSREATLETQKPCGSLTDHKLHVHANWQMPKNSSMEAPILEYERSTLNIWYSDQRESHAWRYERTLSAESTSVAPCTLQQHPANQKRKAKATRHGCHTPAPAHGV